MASENDSRNRKKNHDKYSEKSFWAKIAAFARKAGKGVVEKALILYYCLQDPDTPAWAKGVIMSALGYFIFPADVIPDFTPVTGLSDDLLVLAAALAGVLVHIKPEHRRAAKEKMKEWFEDD